MKKSKDFESKLNQFEKKINNNCKQNKYDNSEQYQKDIYELNNRENFPLKNNFSNSDRILKTIHSDHDDDMNDYMQNPSISVIPNTSKEFTSNFNSQSDVFVKQFNFHENDIYVPKFNRQNGAQNKEKIFSQQNLFLNSKDKGKSSYFFNNNFFDKKDNYNSEKDRERKSNNIDDVLDNLRNFECTPKRKLPYQRFQ